MTGTKAAGTRILALALLATIFSLGLVGCSSVDSMLSNGGTEQAAQPPGANPPAGAPQNAPEETPAPPPAPVAMETAPPLTKAITPVTVEPGADTGTAVGKTIANLRSQLQTLETKLGTDAQGFADLKNTSAQAIATYQQSTSAVATRLVDGTTRGNPELIRQWNTAQSALDTLTTNINALSALASELSNDSSAARYEKDTIQSTFNASGATDEDHRQLGIVSNETGETIAQIDAMMSDVGRTIQRHTAYVANERGNLTMLASAIKAGEYYAPMLSAPGATASNAAPVAPAPVATGPVPSGTPIITIKFARSHLNYDRVLYSALSRALTDKPSASFNVVAISPARGTDSAIQLAQNNAQRHAQEVVHSMGEMGVPASRMNVSSSTDPSIPASEVRVYVK